VTKYISPGDPAIARMDSEERIHGENGVDDSISWLRVSTEAAMIIGQIVGGKKLELDLPTLVDTRLLIQANSGGGRD
jgi:hypothetical protein